MCRLFAESVCRKNLVFARAFIVFCGDKLCSSARSLSQSQSDADSAPYPKQERRTFSKARSTNQTQQKTDGLNRLFLFFLLSKQFYILFVKRKPCYHVRPSGYGKLKAFLAPPFANILVMP